MRNLGRLVLSMCLFVGMTAGVSQAAVAAFPATKVSSTTYTSYSQTKYFTSTPLKTCFTVTLSGTIKRVHTYDTASPRTSSFTAYTLGNPTLTNAGFDCVTGYGKSSSKWTIKQAWWDYSCSLNPSVSAGFPWSVAVSVTPNCGSRKVASRTTSYGASSKVIQYNSGYPVYFGSVAGSPTSKCFSASTQTTAYLSSVSDTFVLTGFKACA